MSYKLMVVDDTNAGAAVVKAIDRQTSISDASVAHALNATFSDTEVEATLNALGAKINLILDALDAVGLTA